MRSDAEKLEHIDKLKSYVCDAAAFAVVAAVILGAVKVFHKDFFISFATGAFMAVPIAAVAAAVTWVLGKAEDRVLRRIWGD